MLAFCFLLNPGTFAATSSSRKQEALAQFEKAEQMREALNGRPASERTRRDYQKVADAYRKVYYVSPASSRADTSVVAVAELLAEMGRQFEPGDRDLHSAVGQYEFLRREYPGSKYRVEALFTIGQIYKEDLGDDESARATFQDFLKHYPHSTLAPDAKAALADLNAPKSNAKPVATRDAALEQPAATAVAQPTVRHKSGLTMVTGIRHWSSPDYTRVAIDVDGEIKYEAGRVPNPDRIFFDLPETKLASVLIGKSFDVRDGFLKKIRVAQYQPGSTRVVLEVDDVSEYSAFLLPNPYRLIIDVHGRQAQGGTEVAKRQPAASDAGVTSEQPAAMKDSSQLAEFPKSASTNAPKTLEHVVSSQPVAAAQVQSSKSKSNKVVVETDPAEDSQSGGVPAAGNRQGQMANSTGVAVPGLAASPPSSAKKRPPPASSAATEAEDSQPTTVIAKATPPKDPLFATPGDSKGPELKATTQPTNAPTAVAVTPRAKGKKSSAKTATNPSVHEAAPTAAGERSLTRALGLKIGRIVIDAGHGGHDTGTIGPNGLMEKDLVLDVALRLGRLLETRLGADVVYTRDDDTFIPLETRTAIANEHQADLFISIHANSSLDAAARGVETYYLNFTSNADALEVAARENAVSEKSIHELQDLVKKITLKDKIEESKELAGDVQQSLYSGLAGRNSTIKDRGVKKAPFVVLIGANMPSILAEISFVSNPTDEARLELPEYRQKIAESLCKGISKYIEGLSGVKVASRMSKEETQ